MNFVLGNACFVEYFIHIKNTKNHGSFCYNFAGKGYLIYYDIVFVIAPLCSVLLPCHVSGQLARVLSLRAGSL